MRKDVLTQGVQIFQSALTKKQRRLDTLARYNVVSVFILIILALSSIWAASFFQREWLAPAGVVLAFICSLSPQIARQWERGIILRLGKFQSAAGPGLFWIFPLIDRVAIWVDQRVITTSFMAQKTLTKDTVPVDVDAVLFWLVWDSKKSALEVENYKEAIWWAAQTALRDIIGKTELADLLAGRDILNKKLQETIDKRTEPWGITVQAVEIRDVVIPDILQDAMSRQAQAERERQARVILGTAETQIASKFVEAARQYENNQTALHLRAMNMLYEGLKEKGALVVVPSTAVESMGLGTLVGLTALGEKLPKSDRKSA